MFGASSAAFLRSSAVSFECEIMATWLDFTKLVTALALEAMKFCASGGIIKSFSETWYHKGTDFKRGPSSTISSNRMRKSSRFAPFYRNAIATSVHSYEPPSVNDGEVDPSTTAYSSAAELTTGATSL
jgi:hypothetical protein